MWKAVVVVALLASCRIVRVPAEAKGDTHVQVYNELAADLCEFSMTASNEPAPANWFERVLPSSRSVGIQVRPGTYKVRVGCGMQFHGVANVTISGPTDLWIGQRVESTSPSVAIVIPVAGRVSLLNYGPANASPPARSSPSMQPTEEPNQCWPDGHACEAGTDPCCHSCGWDQNNRHVCR